MNKTYVVIISLIVSFESFLCGKMALTHKELELLNDIESTYSAEDTVLTLNLPVIGELDLYQVRGSKNNISFITTKPINLDLSPMPIVLEEIFVKEIQGNLEIKANAKIFGRNAEVLLGDLKRAAGIKIIEDSKKTKIFLDISEMTLIFKFDQLEIKLLNRLNLKFNTASIILRKDKSPICIVKSKMLDQMVDFKFIFMPEGITLIKYFIMNDLKLSRLFSGTGFDYDAITLKSISLTNEYKTDSLFSRSLNFKVLGHAFADVNIIDENLPINLVDLPSLINCIDGKNSLLIKLPEFKIPQLGSISKGYLKVGNELKLIGYGIITLPFIGNKNYELHAIYKNDHMVLRGKFDHSLTFKNVILEMPKFIFNRDNNALKIVGKSKLYGIDCAALLIYKDLNSSQQTMPILKIYSMQKNWKPFSESNNSELSKIELSSLEFLSVNNNGEQQINLKGKTKFLNGDALAEIDFLKSSNGIIPVLKVSPLKSNWKLSDSFEHIKKFDNLSLHKPQFLMADFPFYDSDAHIYFNKGISFKASLLLNKEISLLNNLNLLTDNDILLTGSISNDLKDFTLQAPLLSELSTRSKLLHIGPMSLQLNSNAPLSIMSTTFIRPTDYSLPIDFVGNFKLSSNKLIFDSISSQIWQNIFSVPGLTMINPKLHITLDKDTFSANSMPENIVLEGDILYGDNKMYAHSSMNEDFSKFLLTGQWHHFWLNELVHNSIVGKRAYSVLPPLEITKIAFIISPDRGLELDGRLSIFGFDTDAHCLVNGLELKLDAILPKIIAPGLEISGINNNPNPIVSLEARGNKNLSKLIGTTRFGNLIEIQDPIAITNQGCSFESNTTIGKQKFGVKIIGKSLGFIKAPEFDLDIMFKNDTVSIFRNAIRKEVVILDRKLREEINTVIADTKLLENNLASLEDSEQQGIVNRALEENKRKLINWVNKKFVTQDSNNQYNYYGLTRRINLREIKFIGSANIIDSTRIPLTYVLSIFGEKREVKFITDFANLDQTISELASEIIDYALNDETGF